MVGIIMGSKSDLPVMEKAYDFLKEMGIETEMSIVSAHRTPNKMYEYAKTAKDRGIEVIIAGAGGAAHLPGMVASLTLLPVIGVPVMSQAMNGLDSLYSIVQMPPGIPVATVAINASINAAILAAEILALKDETIHERLVSYRKNLEKIVEESSKSVEKK